MSESLDYRIARALDLVGDTLPIKDADPLPLRNAPSPLGVFLPFIGQRGERRKRRKAETGQAISGELRQRMVLNADLRWHKSEIVLSPGESVQANATGRLFLSRPLEVSIGPKTCVWYRIGDGEIRRLPDESGTITSDNGGALYFQIAMPGAFGTASGEINEESPPPPMQGSITIQIVSGAGGPQVKLPEGWEYFWRIGEGSIYTQCKEDETSLCCDTHGDVGIIKYPLELPLDDDLQFDWSWCVDTLPSKLAEHVQPTHDYLSIAVEFDNGLDVTYMWSCSLPVDTIFQCPLPWWDKRETHWVLRRPEDGLGTWHDESRNIRADYIKAIGGPVPEKVVAVWLIANSAFQCGHGKCRYRGIKIGPREAQTVVF